MKEVRRFDILYADLSSLSLDNHFVVIVSNWKNNIKSNYVNCCIITSKAKNHPYHVFIQLQGKQACINCEDIYTIKKNKLLRKIDSINDIFIRLKIEECLEGQLQLNNYNNLSLDELRDNFLKMNSNLIESDLVELNKQIRELAMSNVYEKCIELCNEMINKAKQIKHEGYLWYANYHRALMNIKLENYYEALEDIKNSFNFIGNIRNNKNDRYAFSMSLLSRVYEKIDPIQAIGIYKILAKYHKLNSNTNIRIACIFNVAKLQKNINRMNQMIKIVESTRIDRNRTSLNKEQLLKEMKEDLANISK